MRKINYRTFTAFVFLLSLSLATLGQSKAFDTSRMDRSVAPCDDFFQHVNGNWLKSTEIPASESRWGTFNILTERNNLILKEVLEAAAKKKAKIGSDSQLVGDFYTTCMDEAAIEKAGTEPLKIHFAAIDAIKNSGDVSRVLGKLHDAGIPAVFGFGVGPDLKDSNAVMLNAGQGGLSLPNREYYTNSDEKSVETRTKFVEYATQIFTLLGDSGEKAVAKATTVMAMQTKLAEGIANPGRATQSRQSLQQDLIRSN